MTVLPINSSARRDHSNTRIIGRYRVAAPGEPVVGRDLVRQALPTISAVDLIAGFYSNDISGAA